MLRKIAETIKNIAPAQEVAAHCDGPCGVYDPASARIAAEAAVHDKKILLWKYRPKRRGSMGDTTIHGRYIAIEEQAHLAKEELLVLWTDYFKPPHLEKYPNLHETFWKAAKLCSTVKVEVNAEHAQELMDAIQEIHNIFWESKGREVTWYTAS